MTGILNPTSVAVLGNGLVVHLPTFFKELEQLDEAGISYKGRIFISDRAHVLFDYHQVCEPNKPCKH